MTAMPSVQQLLHLTAGTKQPYMYN